MLKICWALTSDLERIQKERLKKILMIIEPIREIVKYRELLFTIAARDIRVKYKQSVMGFMWAVFMPMLIVMAGALVRYGISVFSNKPLELRDIAIISVKSVPWAFFVSSIRFSTNSLVGNASLVTKIYFAKMVIPIASIISQFFDLAVASIPLIVALSVMHIGLSINLLWVPIFILIIVLLATGMGIFLSAANLFYRDVRYIVEVILTFAIFFTPVFYDVSMFGKWAKILLLNPIAPILEGLSACIVYHQMPQIKWVLYSALLSMSILIIAFIFFKKLECLFAERI